MRSLEARKLPVILAAALLSLAGCGGGGLVANPSNSAFSISPGLAAMDTNCTGCNTAGAAGGFVHQFKATLNGGGTAKVAWTVSGGDPVSGAGSITADGQYSPPSYLTADRAEVLVTAKLATDDENSLDAGVTATALLTVTPGFLQPLTPENLALGANGSVTVTGLLAEAGGATGIHFALASSPDGQPGGLGTLGAVNCHRGNSAYTACSVTYTAPAILSASSVTYIVATAGPTNSHTATAVLLNTAGVVSNPATHQAQLPWSVELGSSGGSNSNYDAQGNQIVDCCGGTLGALVQDGGGRQYLLSNNHVLAASDHGSAGDTIVQPGLIDSNCAPQGLSLGAGPVATLSNWLPLSAKSTNADVAIAQVASRAVDPAGSILEFGARQADGTLAAAPPGTGSTGGKGEATALNLQVAKSGRTTGLTCGAVSAVDLDVRVEYFSDCAETKPYLTKTFTNQFAMSGNAFMDAGDSGALVVDAATAEPVGLLFAGGTDVAGVAQAVANPTSEVLSELGAQAGGAANFTFVGTGDHAVSCMNYGDSTTAWAQERALSVAETARGQLALAQARLLVNPTSGILGVAAGKSYDHPGESAVVLYVDENMSVSSPAAIDGVRTQVIFTTGHALATGSVAQSAVSLSSATLGAAIAIKQREAATLMKHNPAFFGVGVGQSLDNPREAALIIYVDRHQALAQMPATIDGLRTRYILMDRLHVTRSFAAPSHPRCRAHNSIF